MGRVSNPPKEEEEGEEGAEAAQRGAAAEDDGSSGEVAETLLAAGFRPLSARDIALSSALNVNYLWRLSLTAQMTGLDPTLASDFGLDEGSERLFGGRAVLWCRGYGSESSSGRLLLPKIDFLQVHTSTGRRRARGRTPRQPA